MEVLSLEVFGTSIDFAGGSLLIIVVVAPSRGKKLPDPGEDEIAAIFWSLHDTNIQRTDAESPLQCESGVIVVGNEYLNAKKLRDWRLDVVDSELNLLNAIVDVVHEFDPDIVVGWEIQAASWGYLAARGRTYGQAAAFCS